MLVAAVLQVYSSPCNFEPPVTRNAGDLVLIVIVFMFVQENMDGETIQANFITKDAPISLSVQPDVPCTPACARTRRRANLERRRDDPACPHWILCWRAQSHVCNEHIRKPFGRIRKGFGLARRGF